MLVGGGGGGGASCHMCYCHHTDYHTRTGTAQDQQGLATGPYTMRDDSTSISVLGVWLLQWLRLASRAGGSRRCWLPRFGAACSLCCLTGVVLVWCGAVWCRFGVLWSSMVR